MYNAEVLSKFPVRVYRFWDPPCHFAPQSFSSNHILGGTGKFDDEEGPLTFNRSSNIFHSDLYSVGTKIQTQMKWRFRFTLQANLTVAQAQAQAQQQLANRKNPQELLGPTHLVEPWAQPPYRGQHRAKAIVGYHQPGLHGHRHRVGIYRKDQRMMD